MPNPRKTIDFTGLDAEFATFLTDGVTIIYDATQPQGNAAVGRAVSMSAAGTVQLAADGDSIIGRLELVESDGMCSVQVDGFCTFPAGTAAAVTLGAKIVGALLVSARGYVRAIPAATGSFVQATVNDAINGRHKIIDNATTTALVVNLE